MIILGEDNFKKVFPRAKSPELLIEHLNKLFPENSITTKDRVAIFLAQCGHESGGFSRFTENLNYSAESLNRVFPKYFIKANREAKEYSRQPEKIANVVYANRMGNGNEASGEGWKYRGRGLIQLTGKDMYKAFANYVKNPKIVDNPDLISEDLYYCVLSAVWFWTAKKLNSLADKGDIAGITQRINGGITGLAQRIDLYTAITKVLV